MTRKRALLFVLGAVIIAVMINLYRDGDNATILTIFGAAILDKVIDELKAKDDTQDED